MEVNGISRAELAQQLKEMGLSQNENQILSVFDEVDADESIYNVQHNDGKLSNVEMGEFLKRAKDFLGEKAEQLREVFMKTGAYAERIFISHEDGTSHEITTEYNKQGNVTSKAWDYSDESGWKTYYEYDKHGNRTRLATDFDGDEKIDLEERWEYDERGNCTRFTTDHEGDGKIDYDLHYEYNDDNKKTRYTNDLDGDGKVDYEERYEYTENGVETCEIEYKYRFKPNEH